MKGKKKTKVDKETLCEDWCFVCKDGGSLFVCDYKDCLKSYHAKCLGKDESFFDSGGLLKCEWHSCCLCGKNSKFQCYCCTRAYCLWCIVDAEFAKIKGSKGFCSNCTKVLLLGEEQKEVDSDGNQVDMKDMNTHECLLYDYWLAIKGRENLSLKDLHFADNFFKSSERSEIQTSLSNPSGLEKYADESLISTSEDSVSDFSISPSKKLKRSKGLKCSKKKEVKSKKLEFAGWGSKPLIDFLISIGKDTSKELSENDVVSIINGYIRENKLFNPEKKKKILCDGRLHVLFGKKFFMKNSISNLLRLHFRENAEFYEKDQMDYDSDEKSEHDNTSSKKQKKTVIPKTAERKEVVIEPRQSCFASIVKENIKLVYLKKSLVLELLKEPDNFDSKIIGSFVRVKSDQYDMQKNPYQLVQVTGVKHTSLCGKKEDILLQVSNRFNDFPVAVLSDANFNEEECEDLKERAKSGQLKNLTIVELEEKAKTLHLLIMKDWIAKELKLLQTKMDLANEKGQRKELFNYMERKRILEMEAEQKRLLEEVPKVIAYVPDIEPTLEDANEQLKHSYETPVKSNFIGNSRTVDKSWGDDIASSGYKAVIGDSSMPGNTGSLSASNKKEMTKSERVPSKIQDKGLPGEISVFDNIGSVSAKYGNGTTKGDKEPSKAEDSDDEESVCNDQCEAIQRSELRQSGFRNQIEVTDVEQKTTKTEKAVFIDLDSEDDNRDCPNNSLRKNERVDLDAKIWHCLGPSGQRAGPYSISILKRVGEISGYYAPKCKVWKISESEENKILLSEAVSQYYREA